MKRPTSSLREPLYLFLVALAARSALLLVTDNNCTDGLARYEIATAWAEEPLSLPSQVWLPLHFWLLGSFQWLWPGELAARFATLLLGAATVFPLHGIARAAFGRDTALYGTLTYSLLGQHLAYSVCTSSEAPALFFLTSGVYCWTRYRSAPSWPWLMAGGASLSAASLCRFEPWILIGVATLLLLVPLGERAGWLAPGRWIRAAGFGLLAAAGAIGWMLFSALEWGDPLAAPHRTFVQNATDALKMDHALGYRVAVVPGALAIALSPFVPLCALLGAFRALQRPRSLPAALVVLALVAGSAHLYSSITRDVTQARYTLMYSWLLVPLAYAGVGTLGRCAPGTGARLRSALLVGFLIWQGGIVLGAHKGPAPLADKLAMVSATMPLAMETRELIDWLQDHTQPGDAVILDDFNFDHVWITRDAIAHEDVLIVPRGERRVVESHIARFVEDRGPKLLVYNERGQLGALWGLPDDPEVAVVTPPLSLRRLWRGASYRVYQIGSRDPAGR